VSDFGPRRDYGRIRERSYRKGGWDRERRLQFTIGVGAAIMFVLGISIGFGLGRVTAPKVAEQPTASTTQESTLPVGVVEDVPTESVDATFTDDVALSEEPTEDVTPPTRPKQLAPSNGAVLTASNVYLRWSKSKDDSGSVTYSFEIQDRLSGSTYGRTQVIKKLKKRQYYARVLSVKRRWRVWAVDEAGNKSKKSPWHYYIKKYVAPTKKSTNTSDTKSDETT
jgi:hypothetical protein